MIEEWLNEPDRVEFKYKGFPCLIQRVTEPYMGHLCGYVALPPSHPYHGKSYDDIDVTVHGGLTFSGECHNKICHVPAEGEPDNVWWLGFDCAHSFDLTPGTHALMKSKDIPHSFGTYRNIEFVKKEIKNLVDQLETVK